MDTKTFLRDLCGKKTVVRLKWGNEYVGTLISSDSYMNIHLSDCEEKMKGKAPAVLGDVLIRCNNILFILDQEENDDSTSR